jgi:hypothetical protein
VSGQLYAPVALPPGKEPPPPDRRFGEPPGRSGRGGEGENISAPARNRTTFVIIITSTSKI